MTFQRYIRETKNRAGKTVFNARLRYKEPECGKWKELLRRFKREGGRHHK